MGFLMLAGLVGSVLYSSHCIKNDVKAITTDNKIKPELDIEENKRKIRINFKSICERTGIDIDKKSGNPYKQSQYKKGVEYLKYQGYDNESIEYFEKLYNDKFINKRQGKFNQIYIKHNQLMNKFTKSKREKILLTFRKHHYNHENPTNRMNKIMENELWRTIVHHHTYVNDGDGQFCEIWNLKVPKNFFSEYKVEDLYDEVCWRQGLSNGTFTK